MPPAKAILSRPIIHPTEKGTAHSTFADGGTANGYFVYNATTNTYSNINIVTAGGTRASATYTAVIAASSNPVQAIFVTSTAANQTGNPALFLVFSDGGSPQSDGELVLNNHGWGGRIILSDATEPSEALDPAEDSSEYACANATCTTTTGTLRRYVTPTDTGSVAGSMPYKLFSFFH